MTLLQKTKQQFSIAYDISWILWRLVLTILMFCGLAVTETNSLHDLPDIVCGNTTKLFKDCFQNAPDIFTAVHIPVSREEVAMRCRLFQRGMACTKGYLDKCMEKDQRKIVENELYGAQKLYDYLCNKMDFQREFLKNKKCFTHIQKDWEACRITYNNILKDQVANAIVDKMQFMHFCCARHEYENCVNRAARYKCRNDSASFVTTVAKILSTDKRFINCDKVEKSFCSRGRNSMKVEQVCQYIGLVIFVLVRYFLD